jgi:4-hydroxy-4-methyl-2-oxoglutarate aldolase
MKSAPLEPAVLKQLAAFSTCLVASAVETFGVRLRNVGFADSSIRALLSDLSPVVGYAATARLRSAEPPMEGGNYYGRVEWWRYLESVPAPRVVVIEDMDSPPGRGAFLGEVQARVLQAFGAAGVVTNGAVRDLPQVHALGLPTFAHHLAISHSYAHVFDFGSPVEVGHLQIASGDLVHADVHGVQTVPLEVAARVPAVVEVIRERRRQIAAICAAPKLDVDRLAAAMRAFGFIRTSN